MVYGVLKLINFAHGDVMMVGTFGAYAVAPLAWAGPPSRRCSASPPSSWWRWGAARCSGSSSSGLPTARCARSRVSPRSSPPSASRFTLSYGFQLDFGPLPGAAPRAFPEVIPPREWFVFGDRTVVIWNWQVISLLIALLLMVALQTLVYRTPLRTGDARGVLRPPHGRPDGHPGGPGHRAHLHAGQRSGGRRRASSSQSRTRSSSR